ncbi:WD40 domain-containing protein, partial [Klebsiella pneumoniae]|nr:WD40 domain-containing protein [Klebsiella pneumoniae]
MAVSAGTGTHILEVATLKKLHDLNPHQSGVLTGAWRADGKVLATAGETDGQIRFWDMTADPPKSRMVRWVEP